MKSEHKSNKGLLATMEKMRCEQRANESSSQRWKRLYSTEGGPLLAWLLDDAVTKNMDLQMLARELSVTVGYLSQLHSGMRDSANISSEFAAACGAFLGVPSVVVQVIAGRLTLLDFVCASDLDRWLEQMGVEEVGASTQLACGARLGQEELWLLPHMTKVLTSVASVHETRVRMI